MDQTRFLELLNKTDRTPEEEAQLQEELKRQQEVSGSNTPPADVPAQSDQTGETPAPQGATEALYSLEQLKKEVKEAVTFLYAQPSLSSDEKLAHAYLIQADFWLSGKVTVS